MLYDSGATHSFIAYDCVEKLSLSVSRLFSSLSVDVPTDKPVTTRLACKDCTVVIDGRSFVVDLVCLPLQEIDVILGMDWLTANHVMLNCATKTAVFGTAEPQDSQIVSAKRVRSSVKAGAQVFIMLFSVALDKD